ncbi:MAG: anhydro-N-acetylmuramic acid kinase [Chloroflexi bacterium]|nr:anhydro-N-acetylmuramic acid kinase [Chloroflexota bacterium]
MGILSYRDKKERIVVGLMSGTSCDGVDAAVVRISGSGRDTELEVIHGSTFPYPADIRNYMLSLVSGDSCSLSAMSSLNFLLGEIFGASALKVIEESGVNLKDVDLIASHGHTLWHSPEKMFGTYPSTWQTGESAIIAERTGIMTVSDFRTADVAAGGQGAPLVPYVDYLLFADDSENRVAVNIGGIANITVLPAGAGKESVTAFDTGPGNMLIDYFAKVISNGEFDYDPDGKFASSGNVNEELLARFLTHPYFEKKPPKSTGREEFGERFFKILEGSGFKVPEMSAAPGGKYDHGGYGRVRSYRDISLKDMIATVTALTVETLSSSIKQYFIPDLLIASGGGIHNKTLMRFIRERLPGVKIVDTTHFGIHPDLKEAAAFAVLGNETIMGKPGNLPSATGASRPVILGKICGERAL